MNIVSRLVEMFDGYCIQIDGIVCNYCIQVVGIV